MCSLSFNMILKLPEKLIHDALVMASIGQMKVDHTGISILRRHHRKRWYPVLVRGVVEVDSKLETLVVSIYFAHSHTGQLNLRVNTLRCDTCTLGDGGAPRSCGSLGGPSNYQMT
jgi:hypothetical protein